MGRSSRADLDRAKCSSVANARLPAPSQGEPGRDHVPRRHRRACARAAGRTVPDRARARGDADAYADLARNVPRLRRRRWSPTVSRRADRRLHAWQRGRRSDRVSGADVRRLLVSPINLLAQDAQLEHALRTPAPRIVFAAAGVRRPRCEAAVARDGGRDARSSCRIRTPGSSTSTPSRTSARRSHADVTGDAGCTLSGTTGTPEGRLLSHANMLARRPRRRRRARADAATTACCRRCRSITSTASASRRCARWCRAAAS